MRLKKKNLNFVKNYCNLWFSLHDLKRFQFRSYILDFTFIYINVMKKI